ncbi:MAG: hypothetical protein PUC90_02830 [Prevotella sp.]|nr:hypothetical protein [Prevotella sp.]
MRLKGDLNAYKGDRDDEIWNTYCEVFSQYGGRCSIKSIYERVAESPASRFFVHERQAMRVILSMMSTTPALKMRTSNMRMYKEIYKRVCDLLGCELSVCSKQEIKNAVRIVIKQPAPELYVSVRHIIRIVKLKKMLCAKTRLKNILHL